jgi:hypothetical protein
MLVAHGVAGGWDELAVAVVGFVVVWLAVKLAGRKPANAEQESEPAEEPAPDTVELKH